MSDANLINLDLLVKDNIRMLTLPVKRFDHPVAIVLIGAPFSGKTTLVARLSKKFPLVLLSDSEMAAFLAPRATFFERGTQEIFLLASKTIEELIRQKVSVIYDASINKRRDREFLRKFVSNAGGRMVLIHMTLPQKEAYQRLEQSNAQIVGGDRKGFIMDKDLFRYELNSIEKPTSDEYPIICNALQEGMKEKVENQIRTLLEA